MLHKSVLHSVITTIATIWLSVTLAFLLLRFLPGDAVEATLLQGGANQDRIAEIHTDLKLDDPIYVQYARYLTHFIQGDFGYSLVSGRPVSDLVIERTGATLTLAIAAAIFAGFVGIAVGVIASGDGISAQTARILLAGALSMPVYWTATLAILIFAVHLHWLPAYSQGRIIGLLLPAVVLGYHASGSIGRVTEATVHSVRSAPFIMTARSKGLPESLVVSRHILRNALPPIISAGALQFGFLLGGVAITEIIFLRTGLGTLLLDSVINQDYPVVLAIVALSATVYTMLLLATDIVNRVIDPRLRT